VAVDEVRRVRVEAIRRRRIASGTVGLAVDRESVVDHPGLAGVPVEHEGAVLGARGLGVASFFQPDDLLLSGCRGSVPGNQVPGCGGDGICVSGESESQGGDGETSEYSKGGGDAVVA
jgi:hypothetical protein